MTRQTTLRCLLLPLLAATATAACAAKANKAAPTSSLPKDPAALLALAAQRNGLSGPNLKPWHIKATYQLYDAKGKPTETGTFEEWWQGPKEYKLAFQHPGYHFQLVVNAKGAFVNGNNDLSYTYEDSPPFPEYLVQRLYLDPISPKLPAKGMKFHPKAEKFGKAWLNCVEEIPKGLSPNQRDTLNPAFPTYCMDPSTLMLRVFGSYGQSTQEIAGVDSLDGRYIAESTVIFDSGRKYLTVHLDQGESAHQWSPSLFTTPPGAVHVEQKVHVTRLAKGYRISGKKPIYPHSAKYLHLHGVVKLSALIGLNGRLRNLIVISAPAVSLAESALAAVKTWKYKPYLVNGHPMFVETIIRVVYY